MICEEFCRLKKTILGIGGYLCLIFAVIYILQADSQINCFKIDKVCYDVLGEWTGNITDEKYSRFMTYYNEINNSNSEEQIDYYKKLLQGDITYSEYVHRSNNNNEKQELIFALNKIKYSIQYAYDKKEERMVIYQKGWERYFNQDFSIYLLVPLLIVFIFYFFSDEESKIRQLQKTTLNGRKTLARSRIICSVILTVLYIVSVECISLVYISNETNIDHSEYYLQSLEIFENYKGEITIFQAVCVKILLEIVLNIVYLAIIVIIACLFKNIAMGLFCCVLLFLQNLFANTGVVNKQYVMCNYYNSQYVFSNNYNVVYIMLISLIIIVSSYCLLMYKNNEQGVI